MTIHHSIASQKRLSKPVLKKEENLLSEEVFYQITSLINSLCLLRGKYLVDTVCYHQLVSKAYFQQRSHLGLGSYQL